MQRRFAFGWRVLRCVSIVLICFGMAGHALAQEAAIEAMAVTNSEEDLLLYFSLRHGFTAELETAIQNGIPAIFNFEAQLQPASGHGKEYPGISKTFSRTLTYDTLKEEYLVHCSEKGEELFSFHDFEGAKRLMTEICGIQMAPLQYLEAGTRYMVRVRANLARKTLPLNVQFLIPFWKAWDVETGWYSLAFRYEPPGRSSSSPGPEKR